MIGKDSGSLCPDVMVSVVMPAYNCAQYVAEAIRSVLGQTHRNLELIVIDDCSSDDTFSILQGFASQDARVRPFRNERNLGVAATRNRGISLAAGEYVALLDSDDRWHPEKLDLQLRCAQATGAELIYTSYALMDASGDTPYPAQIVPGSVDVKQLLRNNVIGCSTVMLRRALFDRYQFPAEYYHEDYALWLQLLQDGHKAAGLPEVLVDYRVTSGSKAGNKWKSAAHRWRIYRDFMHLSLLASAKYSLLYAAAGIKKYRKRG